MYNPIIGKLVLLFKNRASRKKCYQKMLAFDCSKYFSGKTEFDLTRRRIDF